MKFDDINRLEGIVKFDDDDFDGGDSGDSDDDDDDSDDGDSDTDFDEGN